MGYRSTSITFSFAVVFLLIAILARATALTTQAPWFSPDISAQFYGVTLLTASLLAFGLAALAFVRVGHFDAALRGLDSQLVGMQRMLKETLSADERPSGLSAQSSVDEVLAHLETVGGGTRASGKVGHDAIFEVPSVVQGTHLEEKRAVWEELQKMRARLLSVQDRVWPGVVGPISLAILFVAVSSMMLPGVEGFLVANHQLNTMLILMLAYAWWLLVAWAVVAVAVLPSGAVDRKVFRPRLFERVE